MPALGVSDPCEIAMNDDKQESEAHFCALKMFSSITNQRIARRYCDCHIWILPCSYPAQIAMHGRLQSEISTISANHMKVKSKMTIPIR